MLKMGTTLQEQRQRRGLSQSELAKELHVTRQAVSKWENNQSYPDVETLVKLSQIFDCDVRVLLGMEQKTSLLGLFRWRPQDKEIKWYAGSDVRRREALALLTEMIALLPPQQAELKALLQEHYQRLLTDGTATPSLLNLMNIAVSALLRKEQLTLTPEVEARYQRLLRLSSIRYR